MMDKMRGLEALRDDEALFNVLSQRPIKLGVDDIAPFNILHKDGSVSGFDTDMWKTVADKISVDVELVLSPLLEDSKQVRARLDCLTKPSDISHLTKLWNLNFGFCDKFM